MFIKKEIIENILDRILTLEYEVSFIHRKMAKDICKKKGGKFECVENPLYEIGRNEMTEKYDFYCKIKNERNSFKWNKSSHCFEKQQKKILE